MGLCREGAGGPACRHAGRRKQRRHTLASCCVRTAFDRLFPVVWTSFLFDRAGGRRIVCAQATIERRAVYTFQSKVAERWRIGRVLIAGDAAHLTPPFMGQGMCAGIRDAANLAWKLAVCVRQAAEPAPDEELCERLLESYGSERRPHVREYIATAMRLGELMNTCQTAEELKNTLQPKAKADGAKMKSIAPALGPGLGVGAAGEESRLCPQPGAAEKGEGRAEVPLLDDVVGYAPALLLSEGSQDDALAQRRAEQQHSPCTLGTCTTGVACVPPPHTCPSRLG